MDELESLWLVEHQITTGGTTCRAWCVIAGTWGAPHSVACTVDGPHVVHRGTVTIVSDADYDEDYEVKWAERGEVEPNA